MQKVALSVPAEISSVGVKAVDNFFSCIKKCALEWFAQKIVLKFTHNFFQNCFEKLHFESSKKKKKKSSEIIDIFTSLVYNCPFDFDKNEQYVVQEAKDCLVQYQ
jgi:hypothetical protein